MDSISLDRPLSGTQYSVDSSNGHHDYYRSAACDEDHLDHYDFDCKTRWWSGSDIEDGNLIENPGSAAGRRNHSSNSIRASPSSCPTPRPALHNPLNTNSNISNNTNTNTNTNEMIIIWCISITNNVEKCKEKILKWSTSLDSHWPSESNYANVCRYINIWRKNL